MNGLQLHQPQPNKRTRISASNCQSQIPSWGQIKHLTRSGTQILLSQGKPLTPENLFVAMLALLTIQASCSLPNAYAQESYWAYVPDPPLFHPATWDYEEVKVVTNNSLAMGGEGSGFIHPRSTEHFDFLGHADSLPLCFFTPLATPLPGCLPLSYRTLRTNQPVYSGGWYFPWSLDILAAANWNQPKKLIPDPTLPPETFPVCDPIQFNHTWDGINLPNGRPKWVRCVYPDNGVIFHPYGKTHMAIHDWSASAPKSSVTHWFQAGWVAPTYMALPSHSPKPQGQLYRLFAALDIIILKKPSGAPSHLKLQSCVMSPFAILYPGDIGTMNITTNGFVYNISCKNCFLTNCINSTMSPNVFLIVRQPPYVLLPVNLSLPWYEDPALFALEQTVRSLSRPKRFITGLILGITALIAILGSVAASAASLAKQVHTANHVNSLTKNISLALITQDRIDRGLTDRVNALEEAILYIGTQVQNIKTRLTTSCHANFKWICVTPLPYNGSEMSWEQIQAHIHGVWNNSQLAIDMDTLHSQISAISHSRLKSSSAAELADYFSNSIINFVKDNSLWNLLINLGIIIGLVILLLFLLPFIFKRLGSAIRTAQREIYTLHLYYSKGRDVRSHNGTS